LIVVLGGTVGPVRAYNTNGLWLIPLERIADEASSLIAEGDFKALKIRLGRDSVKDDLKAIAEVRRAVGDDIILMSDFNQGLSFNAALRRLHQLEDQGLEWFEEPIVFDDFAGSARLANEVKTPLQIGENIYGPRHFLQAVAAGAADCYMPDLERIGGVTGWLRSAAIAGAAGLSMSTHLYPEFSAHLMRVTETADLAGMAKLGGSVPGGAVPDTPQRNPHPRPARRRYRMGRGRREKVRDLGLHSKPRRPRKREAPDHCPFSPRSRLPF
jgi:mandelate racemase